ncbi:MAG: Transcriptional regulator, AraC family [Marmoricola sp.]|jgi:AraC family transcriptional activator FtrA|nr:Transcriptional regulator, AraC family [Marmoricola sp.]
MALKTVAVVVPHRCAMFEFGVISEVFGIDRTDEGVPAMEFRVCSEFPGEPIEMRNGVTMITPYGLDGLVGADLVCVPACDYDVPTSPALIAALQQAHAAGSRMLSVCSGAFLLGEAGLLDGRRCTTHWKHADELARRYPEAEVDPGVLFVDDGDDLITSAGTAAGIDACLHLIRCELGADVATKVARRMVVPPQREGGQRQYISLPVPEMSDCSLEPLLIWMRENLHEEQPVRDLAKRSSMSERTFARRFSAETGTTPARWLLLQRLHHARTLLEKTDLGVEAVAARAGFGSAALLRHHFNTHVGVAPGDYRRSFRCNEPESGDNVA